VPAPKLLAGIVMAVTLVASPALSETHTETIVAEQRMNLSVRIAPAAAQAFLPAGWTPNSPNLSLIFMERKLALTPDGKPLQAGVNRVVAMVMSARNASTGEVRSMVVDGISADPLGAPGAYKVYRPGAVSLTRTEQSDTQGGLETRVEEHWAARGPDGVSVELDLTYTRGVPAFSTFEQKNYSGAEPSFYRIYRGQQASEPLRNVNGVNRVRSVRLKASGGTIGRALDGTEEIVSITVAPSYARQTFVQ